MIYECRTYKPNGKLKGIKSGKRCSKEYWDKFENKDFKAIAMRAAITLEGSDINARKEPNYEGIDNPI